MVPRQPSGLRLSRISLALLLASSLTTTHKRLSQLLQDFLSEVQRDRCLRMSTNKRRKCICKARCNYLVEQSTDRTETPKCGRIIRFKCVLLSRKKWNIRDDSRAAASFV